MIVPHLTFPGTCRTALTYYRDIFQAAVKTERTYGDYVPEGVAHPPENLRDWILHAEVEIAGTVMWFSDVLTDETHGAALRLVVTVPTAEDGRRMFARLREGGCVTLPPTQAFYTSLHAGIIDRFGVHWNIIAEDAPHRRNKESARPYLSWPSRFFTQATYAPFAPMSSFRAPSCIIPKYTINLIKEPRAFFHFAPLFGAVNRPTQSLQDANDPVRRRNTIWN